MSICLTIRPSVYRVFQHQDLNRWEDSSLIKRGELLLKAAGFSHINRQQSPFYLGHKWTFYT
jgi:hypothetical protein